MIGNRDRRYLNKGVLLFEGTHMKKKNLFERTSFANQSFFLSGTIHICPFLAVHNCTLSTKLKLWP